jgi:hypothetical protein
VKLTRIVAGVCGRGPTAQVGSSYAQQTSRLRGPCAVQTESVTAFARPTELYCSTPPVKCPLVVQGKLALKHNLAQAPALICPAYEHRAYSFVLGQQDFRSP